MFSPISIDYSVVSFKYYSIRMHKETLFSNYDQLFKNYFDKNLSSFFNLLKKSLFLILF